MTFRVGQKVVCVMLMEEQEGGPAAALSIPNRPVMNGIYTVRAFRTVHSDQYVLLCELRNPSGNWAQIGRGEPPFWHGLFRPLVERKTDISIFTKMLKKQPAPTPAELWEIHHSGAMQ